MPDHYSPPFNIGALAHDLTQRPRNRVEAKAPDLRTPEEVQADQLYASLNGKASSARNAWKRAQRNGAHPRELQRLRNIYFNLARDAIDAEEKAGRLKDAADTA